MSPVRLLLAVACAFVSFAPPVARAQYMYLDSNGDGVHTSADVLYAVGPNIIDVFLHTDQNADGSPATCNTADGDLTINSWVVNTHAVNGTVAYSNYVNFDPVTFPSANRGFVTNDHEMSVGQISANTNAPGFYHLMRMTVTCVAGTPSLEIAEFTGNSPDPCSFGTRCSGTYESNTYEYLVDWFDAAGLPYSTGGGGTPNRPPVLAPLTDMSVVAGASATQMVQATDPDPDVLTVSKVAGPAFVKLLPQWADPTGATAEIHLVPFRSDVGTATATISVSDGVESDEESFAITVTPGIDTPPRCQVPSAIRAVAGTVSRWDLEASDADGDIPRFELAAGPGFVQATTSASRPGGATGELLVTPGVCDVGDSEVRVTVTTGLASVSRLVHLSVTAPQPPPSDSLRSLSAFGRPFGVATGDLNGDERPDLVAGYESGNEFRVFLSSDTGFLPPAAYEAGDGPLALAIADLDADGRLDVVVANCFGGTLSAFLGDGTGALMNRREYPAGTDPKAVAAADVNRDGVTDIVAACSGAIAVLLGRGDGTFLPERLYWTAYDGAIHSFLDVRDLDLDGRLDVVTSTTCLRGLGDGSFETWGPLPVHRGFSGAIGEWNGDGIPDLAVVEWDGGPNPERPGQVRILKGGGDGTFQPFAAAPAGLCLYPSDLVAVDWDADGDLDLATTDWGMGQARVWYFDAGTLVRTQILSGAESAPMEIAAADATGDGYPDLVYSDGALGGFVRIATNRNATSLRIADARAFLRDTRRVIPLAPSNATFVVRLEPVGGSFQCSEVDFASIRMASNATGSAETIPAMPAKAVVIGDLDRNGIVEVPVAFAGSDLTKLFDGVVGRKVVRPRLEGALLDGRRFCASFDVTVQGTGVPLAASVVPNPLNPSGSLHFLTSRPGRLLVRLYDVHGRLVRTLVDAESAPEGEQTVPIDGLGSDGRPLGSGAYFYRVEAAEGTTKGRLMILK